MRKRIKVIVVSYLLCIFTTLAVSASAYELSVPLYAQPNNSKWCWAVSAKMIGDYWYANNNRTAAQAVQYIKGNTNLSTSGNYNDHIAAIKYITHNVITYKRATTGFTDTFIKSKLNGGVPMTVGVTYSGGGGHVMVLRGYNDYFTSIYLTFNDPNGGVRQTAHYLDFMQGTSLGNYNDHFYM